MSVVMDGDEVNDDPLLHEEQNIFGCKTPRYPKVLVESDLQEHLFTHLIFKDVSNNFCLVCSMLSTGLEFFHNSIKCGLKWSKNWVNKEVDVRTMLQFQTSH